MVRWMYERLSNTIAENHNIVFAHLYNSNWVDIVKQLIWSGAWSSVTKTDSPLDDLIKDRMSQKEDRLEKTLSNFNFVFDSPESLHLVTEAGRIEKVRFILMTSSAFWTSNI